MSQPRSAGPALAAWATLRASGTTRGALVTMVRADGGAARALGTHLALGDDGRAYGSVTVGGCADGRALQGARRALAEGGAALLTLPLSEADALALGLGCAGDVDLLIDRVTLEPPDAGALALEAAVQAASQGARAVLLAPMAAGGAGRLLVRADGTAVGGTGDAQRDADAVARAVAELREGAPVAGIREWSGARWFVEPLAPARTVLVVGATEIAAALCALATPLHWRMVLLDPRDDVVAEARFAQAAERVACMPAEVVRERVAGGDAPAVVVVAHDYRVELPVLRAALESDSPYVGMLGSRRRGATMREMLAAEGLAPDRVARLRTPIGVHIGAEGPAEIAVSIVAELIAAWRGVETRA